MSLNLQTCSGNTLLSRLLHFISSVNKEAQESFISFLFAWGVWAGLWSFSSGIANFLQSKMSVSPGIDCICKRMTLITVIFSPSYFQNHSCLFRPSSCSSLVIMCVCEQAVCLQQQALWSARVEKSASLETCGCSFYTHNNITLCMSLNRHAKVSTFKNKVEELGTGVSWWFGQFLQSWARAAFWHLCWVISLMFCFCSFVLLLSFDTISHMLISPQAQENLQQEKDSLVTTVQIFLFAPFSCTILNWPSSLAPEKHAISQWAAFPKWW